MFKPYVPAQSPFAHNVGEGQGEGLSITANTST
jgi:hypothetical protein